MVSTCCIALSITSFARGADIPQTIRDEIKKRVDGEKTVGIIIAITDGKSTEYFGYGKTSSASSAAPSKRSVFEIGSISKVFTAILLADAVNRGEVKYDDPIEKYLPEGVKAPTKDGKSITLETLSIQTSGLPRMPSNFRPKDPTNPFADYTVEQLYEYLGKVKLRRGVGEKYAYSNVGVGLLGHILERATGQTYEELVVSRISNVLKMPDTTITLSEDMLKRLAKGHSGDQEVPNWDLPVLAGAGALRSTAEDMLVFLEANMGVRKTPLLKAMRKTHKSRANAGSPLMDIGLGWHIRKATKGQDVVWHNGGTGGYRTFAGFIQDPPLGVVVLTNSTGAGDDDLGFNLLNDSLPLAKFTPRDTTTVKTSLLEKYVGKYQLAPGFQFEVKLKGDRLLVKLTGQDFNPVFPESDVKFFYKVVDAQITFHTDDDGNVSALTLHQNGRDQKAQKID